MGPSTIHSDESLEELHTSAAELRRLAVDRRRKTAEALTRSYRALFRGRWYPSARASRRVRDGQAVVYDLITRPVIAKERRHATVSARSCCNSKALPRRYHPCRAALASSRLTRISAGVSLGGRKSFIMYNRRQVLYSFNGEFTSDCADVRPKSAE
jgi:hypothetical protein